MCTQTVRERVRVCLRALCVRRGVPASSDAMYRHVGAGPDIVVFQSNISKLFVGVVCLAMSGRGRWLLRAQRGPCGSEWSVCVAPRVVPAERRRLCAEGGVR